MTNEQLDIIEAAARKTREAVGCEESLQADCDYIVATRPRRILDLIAELRQSRAERDWLATQLVKTGIFRTPYRRPMTAEQWLKLAKEAVCQKN